MVNDYNIIRAIYSVLGLDLIYEAFQVEICFHDTKLSIIFVVEQI